MKFHNRNHRYFSIFPTCPQSRTVRTASYSDPRKMLAATLYSVTNDHEPVVITRDRGKPVPLRGSLSGWWSRRLNREHRLVYQVTDGALLIAQCRNHS